MNRIDFSNPGGFPLDTDTLDFLQKSYTDPIKELIKLGGNNYIISGVEDDGAKTTDGWVVINGDIMPFKGDLKQSTIVVVNNIQVANFENGAERETYLTRYATFGVSLESTPFASLARMSDLQQQKKRADDLRADHETHKEHVVRRTGELQAAHEAHKEHVVKRTGELQAADDALKARVAKLEKAQFVPGMIMSWSGSINTIPAGWRLCEALKGQFILGAGGKYAVGATGGTEKHKLTIDEMPKHYHGSNCNAGRGDGLASRGGLGIDWDGGDSRYGGAIKDNEWTKAVGGDGEHNNMPPYYALAYIEYVGF